MLKKNLRFTTRIAMVWIAIGLSGCSSPPEGGEKPPTPPKETAPLEVAEPTEIPPTSPIVVQVPDWIENMARVREFVKETAGEREVQLAKPGERDWNVALLSEEAQGDGTGYPWIEEKLYLYANKVLLARAGVQAIPTTWEEVLAAVDKKGGVEGLTAFFALPGNSPGMFHTLSILSSLCGATSFSHPEEESICVAVGAMGDLYRKGDYLLDHEKGLGVRESIAELGRGRAAMALAWESDALILNDTQTASVASQIKSASPPSLTVHGLTEHRQPTRKWSWTINSASGEDRTVIDIANRLSEWRELDLPFGQYVASASQSTDSIVMGGLFRLDPPSDHAVRETRRILLEGFKNRQTGLEILQGIQIRYEAIREHAEAK
ncbi:MAG: extracellular solute-binding protein [Candidatus Omnitrophica bacterium]|nr:extracellular solute-binding protein [Candidatus Omnitrophota bacterium]